MNTTLYTAYGNCKTALFYICRCSVFVTIMFWCYMHLFQIYDVKFCKCNNYCNVNTVRPFVILWAVVRSDWFCVQYISVTENCEVLRQLVAFFIVSCCPNLQEGEYKYYVPAERIMWSATIQFLSCPQVSFIKCDELPLGILWTAWYSTFLCYRETWHF